MSSWSGTLTLGSFICIICIVSQGPWSVAKSSPCFGTKKQSKAEQRRRLRQMRNLRPNANAQIQRRSRNESQTRMNQMRDQSRTLIAPYLNQANQLVSTARRCRDVSCASAVANRATAFQRDVIHNLLPQLQQLAHSTQTEMIESTKMSLDRMETLYRQNTNRPLPSSQGRYFFPPLCRKFVQTTPKRLASWNQQRYRPSTMPLSNVKAWNDKHSQGLGDWICVGSLSMGNVRCFEKNEDPQGQGRVCEKIGGLVASCYDAITAWTPMKSSGNTQNSNKKSNWASWFDQPPQQLRVMTGSAVLQVQPSKTAFDGKKEEIKQMQMLASVKGSTNGLINLQMTVPLITPPPRTTKTEQGKTPYGEPPAPMWPSLEKKLRSHTGLSPEDIKKMSDGDWARYEEVKKEILAEGEKSGTRKVLEAGAKGVIETVSKGIKAAATWTKQNEENLNSTVHLIENMALFAGPLGPEIATGLEATAKAATMVSRMLVLRAEERGPKEYAKEFVLLLGPGRIKKLQDKTLKKSVELGGFSPQQAKQIIDEAHTLIDLFEKTQGASNGQ